MWKFILFFLSGNVLFYECSWWGGGEKKDKNKQPHYEPDHGEEHDHDEDDFYTILGVNFDSTDEDIKKSYKKMALKFHPDKEGGSEEKFRKLSRAYEVLSNPEKRRVYDQKGEEGLEELDQGRSREGGGGADIFEDLINSFFRGGAPGGAAGGQQRRANVGLEIPVLVNLKDLYNGRTLVATGYKQTLCRKCRGSGAAGKNHIHKCQHCQGKGVITRMHQIFPGMYQQVQQHCPHCHGKGIVVDKECPHCHGTKISSGKEDYKIVIEKGMPDGATIVISRACDETPDGAPGDIVFLIKTVNDAKFTRQGNDINLAIELTLSESLIGFEKTLSHLDGHEISLNRTGKVTPHLFKEKIRGEGMPVHQSPSEFGDLIVTYSVKFPTELSEDQKSSIQDLGTSSTRSAIFDIYSGMMLSFAQRSIKQILPRIGWVEHDPMEILTSVVDTVRNVLDDLSITKEQIGCVGITNQRETVVVWDSCSGIPLYNAIVWLDTRSAGLVADFEVKLSHLKGITGLPVSTYFSSLKINWLIANVDAVREAMINCRCLFGTIDSWILFNLTDKRMHVTDCSNASRYNLMDLETLAWSEELCRIHGIPMNSLPMIIPSTGLDLEISSPSFLNGLRVTAVLGDQQASLVGQKCFKKNSIKATYGTGCFILANLGKISAGNRKEEFPGLLKTIAYQICSDEPVFALEGSVPCAGRLLHWLKDGLELVDSIDEIIESVKDNGYCEEDEEDEITVVPALSGVFSPHWIPSARGAIFGLTLNTSKHNICKAILESVCVSVENVISHMEAFLGGDARLDEIVADGGMTACDLFMHMQSDLSGRSYLVRSTEATICGIAYAAAFPSLESDVQFSSTTAVDAQERSYSPKLSKDKRISILRRHQRALASSLLMTHKH